MIIAICFISTFLFVHNNHFLYERPIAVVIDTSLEDKTETIDQFNNNDVIFTQELIAKIKNGEDKGKIIHIVNKFSTSKLYDHEFQVGNQLFVSIEGMIAETEELTGTIVDVKRDKYLLLVAWIFFFVLLIVGKKQGLFSMISLLINAVLLTYALHVYINHSNWSLLLIISVSVVIFTVISLLLVNGLNEKTYAAIIATLIGTFLSLLITCFALSVTSGQGLRYEELQFITRSYQTVFLAGLFIGSLGAVMDVAITMSSSIFGLYEKDHNISVKSLIHSGLEIGRDIMGTMTNILFFAYVSGSIPIIILYLMNMSSLGFTLSINLSLELARALAGGIGIVITIPIGLYTAIYFVKRKRANS